MFKLRLTRPCQLLRVSMEATGSRRDASPAMGRRVGTIPLAACRESSRFTKQIGPITQG